jgi:hypothetical protein
VSREIRVQEPVTLAHEAEDGVYVAEEMGMLHQRRYEVTLWFGGEGRPARRGRSGTRSKVTVERWTARLWDQKDNISVSVRFNVVLGNGEEQKQYSPSARFTLGLGLANAGYVASHANVAQWRRRC